jgi:Protein of unknown function (DUF3558)
VRTRLPLIAATLGILVASACTTTSAGTPLPASSTKTSNSPAPAPEDDLPSDGAPKVTDPLDAAQFEHSPCETLTSAQAQELNVPGAGEPVEDAFGKGCKWENSQTRGMATVHFNSDSKRGLSAVYEEAKGSDWPYFEQIDDIQGHPAVAFSPAQEKPTVNCVVAVGVSDTLAFTARADLSDTNIGKRDPCDVAAEVADKMMATMLEAA